MGRRPRRSALGDLHGARGLRCDEFRLGHVLCASREGSIGKRASGSGVLPASIGLKRWLETLGRDEGRPSDRPSSVSPRFSADGGPGRLVKEVNLRRVDDKPGFVSGARSQIWIDSRGELGFPSERLGIGPLIG